MELADILKIKSQNTGSLSSAVKEYGFAVVLNKLRTLYDDKEILDYIYQYCINEFYQKRIIIRINKFNLSFYGKESPYLKYADCGNSDIEIKIKRVIEQIYILEKNDLIKNNYKELNLESDKWTLCFLKGPALNKRDFDFSQIESPSLRQDAKLFFRDKFKNLDDFRNDRGFALLYSGLNILNKHYANIKHFSDINALHINYLITILQAGECVTQYNKKYSIESLRKMVQMISAVTEYLMSLDNYEFSPKINHAKGFVFRNSVGMSKNTEIIPDEVIEQLDKVYHELGSNYRLLYEVLKATGMRLKDCIFLEADCLSGSKVDKEFSVLEYTPYKVLNRRKVSGGVCKQIVLIPLTIAEMIEIKTQETEPLRKQTNCDYIFLKNKSKNGNSLGIALAQQSNFVEAVNKLIKKHNILSSNGVLWHYTARQSRKTLAVDMAENGATSQEIASQLGNDKRTTDQYYAEVRKKKMAQMNSDFFKKKFAIYIGEENLKQYSEEERKLLYVDFAMNARDVEFGQCSKHISDGSCKRIGQYNCALCPKLCTGKKYVNKWIELVDSQEKIVNGLLKTYKQFNITDYADYIEYRKELKLLKDYRAVIDKINERKSGNDF